MKKLRLSLMVVMLAGLVGLAYIYPADFILTNMSKVYASRPPMYVNMSHTVFADDGTVKSKSSAKFLWDGKSGFKAEFSPNGSVESVSFKGGKFTVVPEKFPYYPRLMVAKLLGVSLDGKALFKFIKSLGVGYKTESFGRFDGDVAYIIGALDGNLDKPQFWFSKLRDWPVRLIFFKGKDRFDIRFYGWKNPLLEGYAPERIEAYRNGKLIELFEFDSCQIPANPDEVRI